MLSDDILVFEQRVSEHTPLWSANIGLGLSVMRHEDIGEDTVVELSTDRESDSCELLDLTGDGSSFVASQRAVDVLRSLDIGGIQCVPARLGFTQADQSYYLVNILNCHEGLVDHDTSMIRSVDGDGYIDVIKKLRFQKAALADIDPRSLDIFTIRERCTMLFMSRRISEALTSAGLTGFKTFSLLEWKQGIAQRDEYLNPWAFQ